MMPLEGTDSKDRSRNVCHGQRVAAIEDRFESLTAGSFFFNLISSSFAL